MRKLDVFVAAAGLSAVLALPHAAFAQMSPAGDMSAPKVQPQANQETPLPAAIPGAGDQNLPTSQSVAKQQSGDPTTELFTAINANNYSSAQDAISRGADLNAQNSLGETPIDLSVALNHNSITFMLLAARNDSGDDSTSDSVSSASVPAAATPYRGLPPRPTHAVPVNLVETPNSNNRGTPNASAGFLGFNH